MGFYNDVILPRLCDFAMRNKRLVPYRERVIGAAEGQVIEIGIGSGLNLPFYRPVVKEILAIEPAPKLVTMARRAPRPEIRMKFIEASAEAIPIEDHSVDTVVTTWTLAPFRKLPPRLLKCDACFVLAAGSYLSNMASRLTRACTDGKIG